MCSPEEDIGEGRESTRLSGAWSFISPASSTSPTIEIWEHPSTHTCCDFHAGIQTAWLAMLNRDPLTTRPWDQPVHLLAVSVGSI